MALDPNALGAALATAAKSAPANDVTAIWTAIAQALITHLTTAGTVIPGSFTTANGPVTGTGKIQ